MRYASLVLLSIVTIQLNAGDRANMKFIRWFEQISMRDVPEVGGKNASLGEMISTLSHEGITVPQGFAVTADAYWHFIDHNKLREPIKKAFEQLSDITNLEALKKTGNAVRKLIVQGEMPKDLCDEIIAAYHELSKRYQQENADVAVRSSATAEDLPTASFAGQQETFLNVCGDDALLQAYKKDLASLFTDRSIAYRTEKGFDHFEVALSVGVQKMVRSDKACAGVAFSLDTESGFKDVVMIDASYGLGEAIVQGIVIPDEFLVFKPTLKEGYSAIIKKQLGDKKIKIVYNEGDPDELVHEVPVPTEDQLKFCLTDEEVCELAQMVMTIEAHYSEKKGAWCPMDVEWGKDGDDGKLYILQARPETIHGQEQNTHFMTHYKLLATPKKVLLTGESIGKQIVSGVVRVIESAAQIDQVAHGDILVTDMTDPDWVPIMKRAGGIITNRGGRTCHAAIVSRELGIPAIVGAEDATSMLKDGAIVTIDCSQGNKGFVYEGEVPFEEEVIELKKLPEIPVKLMVNIADPDRALHLSSLPVSGVGLARIEFIITNAIKIHPMALLHPEKITDKKIKQEIERITAAYDDKKQFFIDQLALGIGRIAAAFYPREVIVRLSDFKSNEYRNLIGGKYFEPVEENPMIGFRGASRYYNERYREAFAFECAAVKKVRDEMGLTNVTVMIPFVRTLEEGKLVLEEMARNGLKKGENGLRVIMMCEIPSNAVLVDEFSKFFDGFSIGSNDLTQLTLGVDRDSEILASEFDERDPAVKKLIAQAIAGARRHHKYSGICGQAPSDYPEFAQFLIDQGIESISLNPDSVIPFLQARAK